MFIDKGCHIWGKFGKHLSVLVFRLLVLVFNRVVAGTWLMVQMSSYC